MKIVLLCWRDTHHPQGGGSERYLERVAEHLAANGHEVIYCTARYTDAPARSMRNGVAYRRAGGKHSVYIRTALTMLAGRCGFGALKGADIIVDTQNGIPFFARIFAGKPTILLTHHCHKEQWPVAGRLLAKIGWFLESTLSPRIHRNTQVITVSLPSKAELIELGYREENISIIRNGVDPLPHTLPTLAADEHIHLVTLSRLVPHKQIEHAIWAIRDLNNVVLDVIGSGWWADKLQEYAHNQGVCDRVIFHGQVTEDYKHALLDRATIHLMPSRKEGWGLAVLEAAQHKVPTIGYFSAGGLKDSIAHQHTGVLVEGKQQLHKAITYLLDNEDYRKILGENAAKKAAGYSWEETGTQFCQVLDKELHTRP
ncbi:glycosyltransferase family 4 protein [Corynebacterium felinum]|uniref:Glycosyltransferase involved in cell wall biosynthesis n=1 Tax=Corynebacterium felinum TaxID=131318 RepID=A0ABU2B5W6_9CORY|nr:glycosyltransferase family 4 protein [Corynebacterium felinum]MDF5821490.1 glycosyltransferase family 4 protein [Corynebacterium felinum]MDR7354008.1 glycosyltransferase involved in cell wall biosynthesis [Corynebacterium felinum]WJY96182.1 GDP-mannose-dependent alpha-(1-6)-phosphatidylinositol monomannoside mannosyltransferase [Corynebacterium felinum]